MASAIVELTQQRSDSSLASKSEKSHGLMDVEPLNTSGEKHKEDTAKCHHFSIRGYVSEVRKKDPKICYPFSLENSTEPIELPPMVVPQFKWWQCTGCVPEASVLCVNSNKEVEKAEEIDDTPMPLHVVGQSPRDIVPRVRIVESSTSVDSNNNRNYSPPQVLVDRKGKGKAYVEDEAAPSAVLENGFLKDSSQEPLQQSIGKLEVSLTAANEGVMLGSRFNENGIISNFSIRQNDSRVEAIEAESTEEPMNCNEELHNEQCQGKPQDSLERFQVDSSTTDVAADVPEPVSGPSNDNRGLSVNLPDLNEYSGEPEPPFEEKNEAIAGGSNNDVFCEDDDDYLGAERRKYPKFRLLSELLNITKIKEPVKGRKKNTSVPNSMDENMKRKRMGSQDEGSKSVEIRNSNSRNKMMSGTSKNSESDSDYRTDSDDVSIEIISKTLAKRRCKPRIPLNENRKKKAKTDRGSGSSVSRKKTSSKSVGHEKGKTSDALPRKSVVTDQLVDRSSVVTKKRNKAFQPGKETASSIPHKSRLSKEFATKQKDEDAEENPTQKVQKASEVQHLPKIKRNGQVRVPSTPGADGFCLPPPQEELNLADGNSIRKPQEKENNIGETSVAFKTTAVDTATTGNPFSGNGETSAAAKTFLKEQGSRIPEAEELSPPAEDIPPKVSRPVENPRELANEVQRRMRDIDINSIPIDDKVAEDDIPMDIVELMAKNQYERHLSDRDEQYNNPSTTGISGKHIRDNGITNSNRESWQTIGQQPHFLSTHKPSSTDARNYMINGSNPLHVSDYNYNPLSVPGCLPRGDNLISARYLSPSHQRQEPCPSYPHPSGLALNSWNGTFNVEPPQRYPSRNFLQAVESYKYGACAPRQNTTEGHVTWPSVMANQMPLGIANPLMISQSTNISSKVKGHRQSSGSILNFNAAPASNHLRKQQNLNFSNAYSIGGHSESSAGSADMCTNEAIPAMHLLSLMQNAAKMQHAALSLGPQKEFGTSSSRQSFVENNSRASTMQNNSRHPCYPTSIPAARPNFGATFQSDSGNVGRNGNTGFVGPIPLTLRGQRNIESSHFTHPGVDHRPQRQQMVSPLDKGKGISNNPLISSANPLHGLKDDAANSLGKGVRRGEKTHPHAPDNDICQLNQNPSEFNDLRVLSRYMIGPEDLMPKGMVREKSSRPRGDAKRQDMRLNKPIPSDREREKLRKC